MKKISYLLLFFHYISFCNSQGINNRFLWGHDNPIFNPRRNINISNNNIDVDSSAFILSFDAASANISDSLGNLLFYSNGNQVMNKLHQQMQGIDTLAPDWTTQNYFDQGTNCSQEVLIVPIPEQHSKYYIFGCVGFPFSNNTLGQTFKLQYSIIDMSLNGGIGACTQSNTTIITDTLRSGGLTACRHANGRDWWLPVKQWYNNKYYMLLITPNGIQNMGEQAIGDTTCKVVDWSGQTAFSPDGHWYANNDAMSDLNLYEFDRCSGTFTNSIHIPIIDSSSYFGGVSFSPNSKVCYYSMGNKLFQLNLDTTDIVSSKRFIAWYDGFFDSQVGPYFKTYFLYHWLAPNNKIYLNTTSTTRYFHTIEFPDSLGQACGFLQHNVNFNCNNQRTIPNHYNNFLGAEWGTICDSLTTLLSPSLLQNEHVSSRINPNPANTSFYYNYRSKEHTTLYVNNSEGKLIHTQTLYSWFGYVQIECSEWPSGIYICTSKDQTGRIVSSTKLVLEH
jgi:hypothetical protein